jgi:ribulose-phosphate 3-epimerase
MTNPLIIPDILTQDVKELITKVGWASKMSSRVHVDVIDGVFAANQTVMPKDLATIDFRGLWVDVQLMVDEPVEYISDLLHVPKVRVIGHVEQMQSVDEYLNTLEKYRQNPGLGLNLETDVEKLTDAQLKRVEVVLLMSVPVGFSGQKFDERVLVKIARLRQRGYKGDVVMDGGMNMTTIPICLDAGANQFAVNSALWQTKDAMSIYQQLEEMVAAHAHRTRG